MTEFVIAGIPLILIVFGLVEFAKKFNVTGVWLTALSFLFGVVLAVAYQLSLAIPVSFSEWLTVIIMGLVYGLTASGAYDFLDSRLARVP